MNRKQFLKTLGVAMLALLGISTLMEFLEGNNSLKQHVTQGYGSGPYSGSRDAGHSSVAIK